MTTSVECSKSELDLFTLPGTQTSIEARTYCRINPITAVTNDSAPIEFNITSSSDHFIDTANIFLYIRFSIKHEDGSDTELSDQCYPEKNILHTLFSEIDIYLNETKVTCNASHYAYRAFIENLLSYSDGEKKSKLASEGYYHEHSRQNIMMKCSLFEKKIFECYGRIHSDLLHQPRLLLSGCNTKLRLTRNKPSFCIKTYGDPSGKKYIVNIEEIYLDVTKVKLTSHQQMYIERELQTSAAKYPITRNEIKSYTITAGVKNYMQNNIVNGKLPTRILYGLVSHKAYNGLTTASGLVFNHYNLKSTGVYMNGSLFNHSVDSIYSNKTSIPSLHTRAFHTLFSALSNDSDSLDISYEDFKDFYCIYMFDLSQDGCPSSVEHINPIIQGELGINLEFEKSTTENLTLIVYMESPALIQLDKARQAYTDF